MRPEPSTLNPQPSTLNPQPSTLNPQPSNPQPSTLNPAEGARVLLLVDGEVLHLFFIPLKPKRFKLFPLRSEADGGGGLLLFFFVTLKPRVQ